MATNKHGDGIIEPNSLSKNSRALRFYKDDDEALVELHKLVKDISPVSIIDLFRDCVKAGRPIIEARWSGLAAEARRARHN